LSLNGEDGNVIFGNGREYEIASGVGTYGMLPKDSMRTREIRQTQAEPVGSDKSTKRGRPDDLSEIGLADSTRRHGEPVTGGSGQQRLNSSKETWAPFKGRRRALIQRKGKLSHGNGIRRDSSECAVNQILKSVV
jgi:hypothetical protein